MKQDLKQRERELSRQATEQATAAANTQVHTQQPPMFNAADIHHLPLHHWLAQAVWYCSTCTFRSCCWCLRIVTTAGQVLLGAVRRQREM